MTKKDKLRILKADDYQIVLSERKLFIGVIKGKTMYQAEVDVKKIKGLRKLLKLLAKKARIKGWL